MAPPGDISTPLQPADERLPVRAVFASISRNAIPAILTNLLGFVNETTNTLFIGHHGSIDELAAVGIGNMLQNCCGLSIGIGLTSAMDTLISQAHGAGEEHLSCIYLQRARVITSLQMIWILPVLLLSDKWLIAIGQDPEVARLAAEYNTASAPFLLLFFHSSASRRFLSAFLRPQAAVVVGAICAVLHVLWCYIFVVCLGLGNRGLGFANGLTWTLRALFMSAYLWWAAPGLGVSRWDVLGLTRDAFRGWSQYMKIALPALLQTCSEWWFFEICALFVGYLGNEALAAHVTTQNFMSLLFMVPIGVSSAAAALTGNALGKGQPALARQTSWLCVAYVLLIWLFLSFFAVLWRDRIAAAYTRDAGVALIVSRLLVVNAVAGIFDGSQTVLGGVFRGLGRLRAASFIYLVCFYMLMLPAALLLAFPLKCGVYGIYYALVVGTGAALAAFALLLSRTRWASLADEARARVTSDKAGASKARQQAELPAAGSDLLSSDISLQVNSGLHRQTSPF
ncbi:unnamed protein product [Polarella glacialis]|uniref:Multidrug and toxin extrusion protein n=1 Tax=Polarella glacialis TaxID=89957 RepID=A0A813KGJ9_POLGL|nr:unnamed protein product [Polarella glacialis]